MQTFLPLPSFYDSAHVLDWRRLGKQRIEAKQILSTLLGTSRGWRNHPAVKMWKGYEYALANYGVAMCQQWKLRGYKDNTEEFFLRELQSMRLADFDKGNPEWMGDEKFHLSHKSNLIRKLPKFYQLLWPDVPNDLPYVWPRGAK